MPKGAGSSLVLSLYDALAHGGGRSEAMRQAQVSMLHDPRWEHPYYWAAFIVSGADGTLDDKAVVPDLRVHPAGACACQLGAATPPESSAAWLGVATALVLAGRLKRRKRLRHVDVTTGESGSRTP